MESVLLDTSFIIRLVNLHDDLHEQTGSYYKYFIDNKIEMYVSTIAIAEYSVKDEPKNLPLKSFKIIPFDFFDGQRAGQFFGELQKLQKSKEKLERAAIKDDCKMLAQVYNRKIDGFITKDRRSYSQIVKPIQNAFPFNLEFIDLANPISDWKGELF